MKIFYYFNTFSGVAGKRVTRGRIHTIVGLDPAGPLFSLNSADRLAPGKTILSN